jgi:valyl-tRNA synthetase
MLGCHFMLDEPMPDGSKRELKDAVPFREVYIHALIRDADRQKMSKTKGNVIDPIDIINRFGTDAVRFTLASMASPGTDIAFSEARTEGYRAFANKIWNAARFLFMNIDRAQEAGYKMTMRDTGIVTDLPADTPLETRWIFDRLSAVSTAVDRALADYRFDEAANSIYQFFWGELCDWYLELVKLRLDFTEGAPPNPATALTLASLTGVFESALRLLSPFMPFITEEIWHALYNGEPPAKSIALTRYPQATDFSADPIAASAMKTIQDLIVTVRTLRKELGVPEKEPTPILLHASNRILALADANQDMLSRMARVTSVEFASEPLSGSNARSTADFDVAIAYERQIDVPAERERLTKDLAKFEKGLTAAERQLNNEAFMAKAPAHIVEGLRKQSTETRILYDKTKAALDALGG